MLRRTTHQQSFGGSLGLLLLQLLQLKFSRQLSSFRTYSALPHLISLPTAVADVPGVLVTCVHVSGAARALQGVLRRTTSQMALGRLWAAAITTCRRAYTMQSPITHDYQF